MPDNNDPVRLLQTDKPIHGDGTHYLCSRCGKRIKNGTRSRTVIAKGLESIGNGEYIYHLDCLPFIGKEGEENA